MQGARTEERVASLDILTNGALKIFSLPIPATLSNADLKLLDPEGECFHQCNKQ